MADAPTAFGIDFGTTNTRVAYYDGKHLRVVPFYSRTGQSYQFPSRVSYQGGTPVWGSDGRLPQGGIPLGRPIKWLLAQENSIEVDGGVREPAEIAADFFRHLREQVGRAVKSEPLTKAALTIPVHYPLRAREQLQEACRNAGIEVTHFFFEPIAAIYCSLAASPVSGVTAVFDWGGGSLDIATVQLHDGLALTRQIDGWHRGGTDFDRLICEQALNQFLHDHPQDGFTAEMILDRMTAGRDLRLRAEAAKILLSRSRQASLSYLNFLGGSNLDYPLTQPAFEDLIAPDVTSALTRLEQAVRATGLSSPKLLARLYLSGGTCNIPYISNRAASQVAGNRITDRLTLPTGVRYPQDSGGLDDIGNATALGAALLAVHGATPVFASSLGVRLAEAAGDRFYPFPGFQAGDRVSFQSHTESLFVSDAGSGVARLLVCDQGDPVLQPGGRLLRVIPVPIDRKENWLDVTFTLDHHLVLRVEASGRMARARNADGSLLSPAWVQQLNLGFPIPSLGGGRP